MGFWRATTSAAGQNISHVLAADHAGNPGRVSSALGSCHPPCHPLAALGLATPSRDGLRLAKPACAQRDPSRPAALLLGYIASAMRPRRALPPGRLGTQNMTAILTGGTRRSRLGLGRMRKAASNRFPRPRGSNARNNCLTIPECIGEKRALGRRCCRHKRAEQYGRRRRWLSERIVFRARRSTWLWGLRLCKSRNCKRQFGPARHRLNSWPGCAQRRYSLHRSTRNRRSRRPRRSSAALVDTWG